MHDPRSSRFGSLARGFFLAVETIADIAFGALLDSLSPLATLGRGYAILSDEAGAILRRAQDTSAGEAVRARLAEGRLALRVESVEEDDR